jgi:hypothetical protein
LGPARCFLSARCAAQSWLEGLSNLPALRTLELNACNVTSLEGCAPRARAHAKIDATR